MTRSPLFYPMHRGDSDAGGAADLQTDIMRFMAILALCLVAIFALVQSIPLVPDAPAVSEAKAAPPQPAVLERPDVPSAAPRPAPQAQPIEPEAVVELTRPKWVSTFRPREATPETPGAVAAVESLPDEPVPAKPMPADPLPADPLPAEAAAAAPEAARDAGYSLRFESDLALTRLVASGQVGLYALATDRARRMAVSDSRISFWDASTPQEYHEMEADTVPPPVVDALARTGIDAGSVVWGVTLPGRMRTQLDTLMREHDGGALVIGSDGSLRRETS